MLFNSRLASLHASATRASLARQLCNLRSKRSLSSAEAVRLDRIVTRLQIFEATSFCAVL